MLPDFVGRNMPPGGHRATWTEVEERFGRSSEIRIHLCRNLRRMLETAKRCGFNGVVIMGSFVSAILDPKDFDLIWLTSTAIDRERLPFECRQLLDSAHSRENFGCDVLDCEEQSEMLEFLIGPQGFGHDKHTGEPRGLVILRMEDL